MSDLLIRDVDDHLIQTLETQAAAQGTSVEEYAKTILTTKATYPKRLGQGEKQQKFEEEKPLTPASDSQIEAARAFRECFAHMQTTDSIDLLREDRDR